MALDIIPLKDRIIISPIEEEEKTESGIYIPTVVTEKPLKGRVEVIGEGVNPESFEVGDIITYGKNTGYDFIYKGSKYVFLKEHEVLLVY